MLPPVVHHPGYVAPLPAGHRFPMNKYGMLIKRLRELGLPLATVVGGGYQSDLKALARLHALVVRAAGDGVS